MDLSSDLCVRPLGTSRQSASPNYVNVRSDNGRWHPTAPTTLDLQRRTRLSKLQRVIRSQSGTARPPYPMPRDLRGDESPTDMGAEPQYGG